jgi:cytochrome P450
LAQSEPDVLARLLEPQNVADPYPYLARLRTEHPVLELPGGGYLVSSHAEILTVLNEFRSPEGAELEALFPIASRHAPLAPLLNTVAMKNPPEHTRMRRQLGRAFTPRRIAAMRDGIAGLTDRLLDGVEARVRDGESVDIRSALAAPVPTQVVSELIGFPAADRARLFGLVPAVLGALAPSPGEEAVARASEASAQIQDYVADLVEQRRASPEEDLISEWVKAADEEDGRFSFDELMSMVWGVVLAGIDTTASAVCSGILAAMRFPAQAAALGAGDAAAGSFAGEVLRYDGPLIIGGLPRFAEKDTVLRGVEVPAGAEVRLLFAAGNRDPEAFADPDRFEAARDTGAVLTFGAGLHYCLGVHLARLELVTVLGAVHKRLPDLKPAGDATWRPSLTVRGMTSMPVAV